MDEIEQNQYYPDYNGSGIDTHERIGKRKNTGESKSRSSKKTKSPSTQTRAKKIKNIPHDCDIWTLGPLMAKLVSMEDGNTNNKRELIDAVLHGFPTPSVQLLYDSVPWGPGIVTPTTRYTGALQMQQVLLTLDAFYKCKKNRDIIFSPIYDHNRKIINYQFNDLENVKFSSFWLPSFPMAQQIILGATKERVIGTTTTLYKMLSIVYIYYHYHCHYPPTIPICR